MRCVRLPCKFHTSLYMLTQFPPIQIVTGSAVWKTPCELFMLAGIAHKIPNHVWGGINKRRGGFNNSLKNICTWKHENSCSHDNDIVKNYNLDLGATNCNRVRQYYQNLNEILRIPSSVSKWKKDYDVHEKYPQKWGFEEATEQSWQ